MPARSHRGIRRRLGDQGDKLRKRVSYTLRSSLKQIGRQSPDLGEHLKASIQMGFECGYIPLTPVRWNLQPVHDAETLKDLALRV